MYEKKYDVVALGELLIDLIEYGKSDRQNPILEVNAGGAPCNVLAMLNKLGDKTAFIGKVGNDCFGKQLKNCIIDCGIDATGLIMDNNAPTTLAIVHTLEGGEREFSFYRDGGADTKLTKEELPLDILKNTKIFHFGTLSMTDENIREVTRLAIDIAKKSGAILSFDPNLRLSLWKSDNLAKEQFLYGLSVCDILKVSDNEVEWITGTKDIRNGAMYIKQKYPNIKVLLLSMGKEGSKVYYKGYSEEVKAFVTDKTIETTGAGDTFLGCMLHVFCKYGIDNLDYSNFYRWLRFANAGASIITTRKGALNVMPEKEEIYALSHIDYI